MVPKIDLDWGLRLEKSHVGWLAYVGQLKEHYSRKHIHKSLMKFYIITTIFTLLHWILTRNQPKSTEYVEMYFLRPIPWFCRTDISAKLLHIAWLVLITSPWMWNRVFFGASLLVVEYRTTMKSVQSARPVSRKLTFLLRASCAYRYFPDDITKYRFV
jgi:hypothetical protein